MSCLDLGGRKISALYFHPERCVLLVSYLYGNFEIIPYPKNLESIDCSDNFITTLSDLPTSLVTLDCSNNPLVSLSLPVNLKVIYCDGIDDGLIPASFV